MAFSNDPNYAGTRTAQDAEHDHQNRLQQQRVDFEKESKKKDRKNKRRVAWLSGWLLVLGTLTAGALTMLGTIYAAIYKSKETTKVELVEGKGLNPLVDAIRGLGVVLQGAFQHTLTPSLPTSVGEQHVKEPAPPETQSSAPVSAPSEKTREVAFIPNASCGGLNRADWEIASNTVSTVFSGEDKQYAVQLRLNNRSKTIQFLSHTGNAFLTDDAHNRLAIEPTNLQQNRVATYGARIDPGADIQIDLISAKTKSALGNTAGYSMQFLVTPAIDGDHPERTVPIPFGCSVLPVQGSGT